MENSLAASAEYVLTRLRRALLEFTVKVQFLKSSTVVIECRSVRILTDPWLVDGAYYGAWAHYPPFDWTEAGLSDIDYIYISHIHPDHFCPATLRRLPKTIPVLIHRYGTRFLRRLIEDLGFEVIELEHNKRRLLKDGVHITICAADDCDPVQCGRFLGCAPQQASLGSTQLDTLCVIDDGRHVLVNTNDCRYALSSIVIPKIKASYPRIDILLVGYSGAGPFPQCFTNLTHGEKVAAAAAKKQSFLQEHLNYVKTLAPRFFLPFAGQYTLAGRLSVLNDLRGLPEVEEAAACFAAAAEGSRPVLLNPGEVFDLDDENSPAWFAPVDPDIRRAYVEETLSRRPLDYDSDPSTSDAELQALLAAAYERLNRKRAELAIHSTSAVFIDLGDGRHARFGIDGRDMRIERRGPAQESGPYVAFGMDRRLLARILSGPTSAHWASAELGSHLSFDRHPDTYDRGLHHVMGFFHA